MKKLFLLLLISISISLFSETFNFNFSDYKITKNLNFEQVDLVNTVFSNNPGEPMLPIKPVNIIIPFGCEIKNIASYSKPIVLEKEYNIIPNPQENITNSEEIIFNKNRTIYEKDNLFPLQNFKMIGTNRKKGVDFVIIQLYPFQYNPVTKKLYYYKEIELEINFTKKKELENKQIVKLQKYEYLIKDFNNDLFYNNEALLSYQNRSQFYKSSRTSLVSSESPFDYIIITNEALKDEWNNFESHKSTMGLQIAIFTVEDIYANYSGNDNADKIRNFIIDAYEVWSGTDNPLQWILIGGDSNIVPSRQVRVYAYWGTSWNNRTMYTDNYYAGLDGNWDNDADGNYGEGDNDLVPEDFPESSILGTVGEEADWFFEIAIGRASLENSTEIANWTNKTIAYENLSTANNYLRNSSLVGEYLGYGAYGGTAQNEIATLLPDFNHNRLYAMNITYSKQNVVDAINNGTNIISHLGHSGSTRVFSIYAGDVDTLLINTDYCLVYSQGCYTAMFNVECIAESFISDENAAFAYIGNSHYGFYSSYKDQGASQLFEREFFDAIVNEGITNLGNANLDSKEDVSGIIGSVGSRRWVGLDLTLLGDPHISLFMDVHDVSAKQTDNNVVQVQFEDIPGSGADNPVNYQIYQRDDPDSLINISSCIINGNNVDLYLENNIKDGFPYNVEISNVSGLLNLTIRPIDMNSNIIELSIITPTTWTQANGPYYIYEDLIIKGSHLTIEPGTELKFNDEKGVFVYDNGWIKAFGESDNKVIFTSYNETATNGDWSNITIYRDADHENCELDYCLIEYPTSGVVFDSTSTARLSNSIITHTEEYGIYSYCASPTIENVIVAFAEGSDVDYGFYFEHSNPIIKNIVSYENDSYGFCAVDSSNIELINSIVYTNNIGSVSIDSSNVIINYSNIEGGFTGIGNIDSDTLFIDPENDDFSLQIDSPCIDAGDPASPIDPDGTIADMGAIFFDQTIAPATPQNVIIEIIGIEVHLSWDAVIGANSYKVYSSDESYSGFVEDTTGTFAGESWSTSIGEIKKFYHVIASTEIE